MPFVLPEETVRVTTERGNTGLLKATVVEIATPSPERIEPSCPYFGRCGGCQYQHSSPEFQSARKVEILREQLRRLGKIDYQDEIPVIAGPPLGYRNRTQFHLQEDRIGFYAAGSHDLIDVEFCPVSSPRINDALAVLRRMLADARFPRFVTSIELFTNEQDVLLNILETSKPVGKRFFDWCEELLPGAGKGEIEYAAAGDSFRVSHASFFQVNRFLVEALVEAALRGAEGTSALDLYAGVGLFSLHLARKFPKVAAVESGAGAVRDLEFNARRAGLTLHAQRANTDEYLKPLSHVPDFILADPPRSGLGKKAAEQLVRLAAPRLHVVSCDPSTLARDLALLLAGGYRIEDITLVDLFPQTFHLETVVRLVR